MTIETYKALTEEQSSILMSLLIWNKKDKSSLSEMYNQNLRESSFICKVLEKRITVFKLPLFDPSALIFIDLLSEGNPGRAVLMLIETLEAYERENPKPSIDVDFMGSQVYPWGFYTDAAFEKEWDARKCNPTEGYNRLIGPSGPLPSTTAPCTEPEPYRIVNWKN